MPKLEGEESVEDKDIEEEDDSSDESKSEDEGGESGASKKTTTGEESDDDEDADENKDGDDAGDENKSDKSKKSDDDEEPVIPVRKLVGAQNTIARKNKTIDKLRKKSGDDSDDSDDDEDEDDLIPSAAKGVRKEVAKALEPVLKHIASTADETDLKDLYTAEPDAKKFDRSIKAYMNHPAYKGVAPIVIFHHLNYEKAQATGAKKKEMADKEAGKMRGAGSSKKLKGGKSSIPSNEDLENMTDAEFEALQNQVRQGKFKA